MAISFKIENFFQASGTGARRRRRQASSSFDETQKQAGLDKLDLAFNPVKSALHLADEALARRKAKEVYSKMDIEASYKSLFELMWYSQMPCYDVKGVTSTKDSEHGIKKDIKAAKAVGMSLRLKLALSL